MKNLCRNLVSPLLFVLVVIAASFPAARAAPLWIERQFIPEAELVDPVFAICNETSTIKIDHSSWGVFLEDRIRTGEDGVNRIDYGAVTQTEHAALKTYILQLEAVDIGSLASGEQLAFWINLYNAATIDLILENYPVESIRKIDAPWGSPAVTVNGLPLTLNQIESGVIRPVFNDPRIHYAVNCASIGCPNLAAKPYTGATLEAMLDAAARAYVNHPRGVLVEDDDVTVSKIYGWYREDFGEKERDVLDHIRVYARPELLKQLNGLTNIDDYEYDWALNDANEKKEAD
ncbi:MAG: DUF547 domain-containing protein [Pseudomonadota bacterium]